MKLSQEEKFENLNEWQGLLKNLDDLGFPFKKYTCFNADKNYSVVGTGGFGYVLDAYQRNGKADDKYVIKIEGLLKEYDYERFSEEIETQKRIGLDYVVNIRSAISLKVWKDEENNIVKLQKITDYGCEDLVDLGDIPPKNDDAKELHFALMEKLIPVCTSEQGGYFKRLATPDKDEYFKYAYDTGKAIAAIHKANIIHEDIKPTNVFYDEKNKHYKIGDFGIAQFTEDGSGKESEYRSGTYSAPEKHEKHDNTADIYSYGIMIKTLPSLKECFPELAEMTEKMCHDIADYRYQSMEEILDDLEAIVVDDSLAYKRSDFFPMVVLGTASMMIGAYTHKLSFSYDRPFILGKLDYIFLILVVSRFLWYKHLKKASSKDNENKGDAFDWKQKDFHFTFFASLSNLVIYALGIASIIVSGFSWWKVIIMFMVFISTENYAGICALLVLTVNFGYITVLRGVFDVSLSDSIRWVPVLFFSLGVSFLLQCAVLKLRDIKILNMYYGQRVTYWFIVMLFYLAHAGYGWMLYKGGNGIVASTLREYLPQLVNFTIDSKIYIVGIWGGLVGFVFFIKEKCEGYFMNRA